MTRDAAADVHVRIRRLSIDAACDAAEGLDTTAFGSLLEATVSERLGIERSVPDTETGHARRGALAQIVGEAVATHVRPAIASAARAVKADLS